MTTKITEPLHSTPLQASRQFIPLAFFLSNSLAVLGRDPGNDNGVPGTDVLDGGSGNNVLIQD